MHMRFRRDVRLACPISLSSRTSSAPVGAVRGATRTVATRCPNSSFQETLHDAMRCAHPVSAGTPARKMQALSSTSTGTGATDQTGRRSAPTPARELNGGTEPTVACQASAAVTRQNAQEPVVG